MKLWDPSTWSLTTTYNVETDAGGTGVTSVAYSPDNTRFVYGRGDATIAVANTGSAAVPATVTVTTNPAGLAMTVDGVAYTSPQTFTWTPGASHTVAVSSPQGSSGTQQIFANWSDGGSQSHTVTPYASRDYVANFTTQYLLTFTAQPAAGGSVTANPSSANGYYNSGTQVQLTATATPGYTFISWSGDVSGSVSPATITMTAPHSVTGTFSNATEADLAITATASPTTVTSGQPLSFVATITNLGPDTSTNPIVTDSLPAAVNYTSASASQGSCSGTVIVTCTLGSLAAGANATITINVTTPTVGPVSNTITVNGGTSDPNSANNSATTTATVLASGLPPILWMDGFAGNAGTLVTTNDGMIWALGTDEIKIFNSSDLSYVRSIPAPGLVIPEYDGGEYSGSGRDFAVTPDGKYYAYCNSIASDVEVYSAVNGKLIWNQSGCGYYFSFTSDGGLLAYTGPSGDYIVNFKSGSTIVIPDGGYGTLSPDGNWFALLDGGFRLYRTSDGSYVRTLNGPLGGHHILFSSDSSLLIAECANDPSDGRNRFGFGGCLIFSSYRT